MSIYIYISFFPFYFDLLQINRFDQLLSIYRQRSGMFVSSLLKIDFFLLPKRFIISIDILKIILFISKC